MGSGLAWRKYPRRTDWVLNREQLAWAAGFTDGEGCFYLHSKSSKARPNRTPELRFEIGQIDTQALERFRLALPFGAPINGPYDNKNHPESKAKPFYTYMLNGFEDVQAITALLWTWLGPVKRQQAKSVLERYKHGLTRIAV